MFGASGRRFFDAGPGEVHVEEKEKDTEADYRGLQ